MHEPMKFYTHRCGCHGCFNLVSITADYGITYISVENCPKTLGDRIKAAWDALWGQHNYAELCITQDQEIDEIIESLSKAKIAMHKTPPAYNPLNLPVMDADKMFDEAESKRKADII